MAKQQSLVKVKSRLQIDPDKMDKYLDYYATGKPLNEEGMVMLERYRKAWSWLSMGRLPDVILSMLQKEYGLQERQCRYILAEAVFIHGNVSSLDKAGKKVASANFYRLLANMAMMDNNVDAATRAWKEADRVEGVLEEDEAGWDPDVFNKASKFVFINNVNVLQQQLKREMEDDE